MNANGLDLGQNRGEFGPRLFFIDPIPDLTRNLCNPTTKLKRMDPIPNNDSKLDVKCI